MPAINITVTSAPLSEGWEGTPDEFRQQIFSTVVFEATGAFLTGQIGGALPTADVGLFIDGNSLYTWDSDTSAYRPINTVPIGVPMPYLGAVAPDANHLVCDGADYLRADYPALFAIIGDRYNRPSDAGDRFRVVDARGRSFIGAGIGDYDPRQDGVPGRMAEIEFGEYGGREWPIRLALKHLNQPAVIAGTEGIVYSNAGAQATKYTRTVPPWFSGNWIVRAK